ncbi:MAG: hypothetical protein QF704_17570 [Anaerolineales bacterium]|nr:hypothetical protein [Anaerolineales bacterium]
MIVVIDELYNIVAVEESFTMSFNMLIRNPGDLIDVSPLLEVFISDGLSKNVHAKYSGVQSILQAIKPNSTTITASYLISFGIDLSSSSKALGAAVYADPFCLTTSATEALQLKVDSSDASESYPWLNWANC